MKFPQMKITTDNFKAIPMIVTMALSPSLIVQTIFKGISNKYGWVHLQLARTSAVLLYHPFGCNRNGNQENGYIILLFLTHAALGGGVILPPSQFAR